MQILLPKLSGVTSRGHTFFAVLVLLVPLASGAMAQTPFELPPLPGDTDSIANAINNRGQVAGRSDFTAVVWDKKGVPMALPPFGPDCCGSAHGINTRGEVVGISTDAPDTIRVVVWDRSGTPSLRPRPPLGEDCAFIFARGINNRGEVVGWCDGAGPPITTAVLWDRNGMPNTLSPLPGDTNSRANAINARGEVAGTSSGSGGSTAVVWDRRGNPTALQPLAGDTNSAAFAINARGEVAGWSSGTPFFGETAVVWDRSGSPRALQSLDDVDPSSGGLGAIVLDEVNGINARGEVVGMFLDLIVGTPPDTVEVAVVWDRNGKVTKLPPPEGAFHAVANAINARGEIAGFFFTFDFDGNDPDAVFPPVIAVVWR